MENKNISVIILAAGNGKRMKTDLNKLFLEIGDKPLLAHTIDKFYGKNDYDEILIVLKPEDVEDFKEKVQIPYNFKNIKIVEGGKTRQESAYNGIQALDKNTGYVLIHDGARPFVTEEIIEDCIDKALQYGASVAAIPATDTIKLSQNGKIIDSSLIRDELYEAQTPQGFSYPLILKANQVLVDELDDMTDDAQLLEKLGYSVALSKGSKTNVKVTTPDDLIFADAIEKIV